jgi:Predicted integral membrane protein
MQAQGVDMGKGLAWYGDGWEIFTRNPGMWIVLMILLLVIAAVLNLVPLLGPLLFALLLPGLFGGALYAARAASEQREMDVSHLFIGFKDSATRNALLVLGAVLLGANILFLFLALLLIGSGMGMAGMLHQGEHEMLAAGLGMGMLLALLLLLLLGMLLSMTFLYAVPLVMFAAAEPVAAMKSSFSACLNNVLPLLLFGVIYIVLATIAVLPFGLGLLVLLPVTFGALYASYRDIYAVLAA